MPNDTDKILDILESAQKRVESLEGQMIYQQAMIQSLLRCVSDNSSHPPEQVMAAFKQYRDEAHQRLLEAVEDANPGLAARVDKRPQG
jgi:hypothetical protein